MSIIVKVRDSFLLIDYCRIERFIRSAYTLLVCQFSSYKIAGYYQVKRLVLMNRFMSVWATHSLRVDIIGVSDSLNLVGYRRTRQPILRLR